MNDTPRHPTHLALALVASTAVPACAHQGTAPAPTAAPAGDAQVLTVTAERDRPGFAGGDVYFTGAAQVSMLFSPGGARDFGGAYVTFEPGARTAWHTHPAGQTLVVTAGSGWVQAEGQPRRDMGVGDVVWIPPHVRHWHGATDASAMTHIALQGEVDGEVVQWAEPVTDSQYMEPQPL